MSDEVKGLEGKSIIVHEDVMPEQVNGKLIYPRAYFEADVKELVKRVRYETLKAFELWLESKWITIDVETDGQESVFQFTKKEYNEWKKELQP